LRRDAHFPNLQEVIFQQAEICLVLFCRPVGRRSFHAGNLASAHFPGKITLSPFNFTRRGIRLAGKLPPTSCLLNPRRVLLDSVRAAQEFA